MKNERNVTAARVMDLSKTEDTLEEKIEFYTSRARALDVAKGVT